MTTANFRTRVANYIGRSPTSFVDPTSGFDNLLAAINDTRRDAQQMYDWQGLRSIGFININGSQGAPWATAATLTVSSTVTTLTSGQTYNITTVGTVNWTAIGASSATVGVQFSYNGVTITGSGGSVMTTYGPYYDYLLTQPMVLKKIDSVWNYTLDTNNVPLRTNRIDFGTEQQFKHQLPTNSGYPFTQNYPSNPPWFYNTIPSSRMFAYVTGPTFYVNSASLLGYPQTTNQFMIVGLTRLGDLLGAETSDFFLDNYQTWALLQTLQNLNNYVKEDQRVQIGAKMLNDAWTTATFMDAQQAAMGEWSSLD